MSAGPREIDLDVRIRGETFRLLHECALLWPREGWLVVADFHLGKAEAFGHHGLVLPGQAQHDDLGRLSRAARRVGARRIVFLGDLVHAREGLTPELRSAFAAWLGDLGLEATLVGGNHDRFLARDWPAAWSKLAVQEELASGDFVFRHEPPEPAPKDRDARFVWAGHVHPCVRIAAGADRLRLRTFVVAESHGLLPAFSTLAGGFDVDVRGAHRLYPVAGERVFSLGTY